MKPSLILFLFFIGLKAYAVSNLAPSLDIPTAKVLPKGVRNFRYKTIWANIGEQYNQKGEITPLSESLTKEITWKEIVKLNGEDDKDALDKKKLQGLLWANNVPLEEKVGEATGAIKINVNTHVFALAYGVTEQFTGAIAVPTNRYTLNVNTAFSSNKSRGTQAIRDEGKRPYEKLREKLERPLQQKLADFGYSPLVNEKGSNFGDIKLIGRYQQINQQSFLLALNSEISLPTSKKASPYKSIDVTGGESQLHFSAGLSAEYQLVPELTFSGAISHIYRIKDQLPLRVPEEEGVAISPDIDWKANRRLGDISKIEAGLQIALTDDFNFSLGHAYQLKQRDTYSRGKTSSIPSSRYQYLERETQAQLHTTLISLSFHTITKFQQKKFPLPMESKISLMRNYQGKNINVDSTMTSLDLAFFF